MISLGDSFGALLSRPVTDDPVKWLEENIYLDSMVSANAPGQLSLARQPWARQLVEDIHNPAVQHLTMVMGAQTGKSMLIQLAYLLLAQFRPQPAIIAFPDDDLAERFVKGRLRPLIDCNPDFARRIPPKQEIGQPQTLFMRNMQTFYTGCRSPQKLSSFPAAYLFLDEAAKLVKVKAAEAHPYLLLKERVKSFPLHKIIEASTPASFTDPFWESFNDSSKSKYWMPCPHCGDYMEFVFDNDHIRWTGTTAEEVIRSTRIYCPSCGGPIDDTMRREMMKEGEWRKSNESHTPGHHGYHLNSMYSCWKDIGEVAWEYVKACHSLIKAEALHNFWNSWLALPWEDYKTKVTEADVRNLVNPNMLRGVCPADMEYLVCGVDPGQTAHHYVVTAVCTGGTLKVVDWGTINSISSDKGREGLRWLLDNKKYTFNGNPYNIDIMYCDAGYNTNTVYDEARSSIPGLIRPSKGTTSPGTWGRSIVKTGDLDLYTYSDFSLKVELYGQRFKTGEVMLPRDADRDLMAGLSGQTLIQTSNGTRRWKKVDNDHFGDCLKLALLSAWVESEDEDMRQRLTAGVSSEKSTLPETGIE